MALTEEQKKRYFQFSACPYCDSSNIQADQVEQDGNQCRQKIYCDDCGKTWTDVATFTEIEEDES